MGPTGDGEKDLVLRSLQGNRRAWIPPASPTMAGLGLPTANRSGQPHCAERPSHLQRRSAGGCLLTSRFSALTLTRISRVTEYGVGVSVCLSACLYTFLPVLSPCISPAAEIPVLGCHLYTPLLPKHKVENFPDLHCSPGLLTGTEVLCSKASHGGSSLYSFTSHTPNFYPATLNVQLVPKMPRTVHLPA